MCTKAFSSFVQGLEARKNPEIHRKCLIHKLRKSRHPATLEAQMRKFVMLGLGPRTCDVAGVSNSSVRQWNYVLAVLDQFPGGNTGVILG